MSETSRPAAPFVVVTGAAHGIGAATALALCQRGFQVFAGVRRESDGESLRAKSPRLTPLILDITDSASIQSAAESVTRTIEVTGGAARLAGLVNNAGVAMPGPLEFLPLDAVRRQFEVNVVGQLAVTQALLPLLRKANGRIVNVGSIGGRLPLPWIGAYHASKAALAALSDSLRAELRPWGIKVVLIEPGNVVTPIWQTSLATGDDLESRMPATCQELYGPALAAVRSWIPGVAARGLPPERVAQVIVRALTARYPRSRYLVGRDAWMAALLTWFPGWFREMVLRRLALPGV